MKFHKSSVPASWHLLSASMEPKLSPRNEIQSALPRAIGTKKILLQSCRRGCKCNRAKYLSVNGSSYPAVGAEVRIVRRWQTRTEDMPDQALVHLCRMRGGKEIFFPLFRFIRQQQGRTKYQNSRTNTKIIFYFAIRNEVPTDAWYFK